MTLTALQHDALLEAFNIAVSRAAVSLSRLMNETITLSVPQLELLSAEEAVQRLVSLSDEQVATVSQHFEGDIDTRAVLLFAQSRALEIVRLAVGGLVGDEDLPELEQEAIAEVGNILLNACMSALSNQLGLDLKTAPPAYLLSSPAQVLTAQTGGRYDFVLMIHITLNIESRDIVAFIAFLLDARANEALAAAVDRFLSRYAATA
jgi:chemotaxis protein CheC